MSSFVTRIVVICYGMTMLGCGVDIGEIAPKATERVFREGRVYVLNNIRPFWYTEDRTFFILYEGQRFDVLHNINYDGEPTLRGAVLITPEPLPGGTELDFDYSIKQVGDQVARKLSAFLGGPVVIDGDITIEFYNEDWEQTQGIVVPKVLIGKQDGIHVYKR